jgi:hypothetical protein
MKEDLVSVWNQMFQDLSIIKAKMWVPFCLPKNENRPMFRDVCIQLLLIDYKIFTRRSELDHLSWPVSYIPPNTGAPRRIIIYATSSLQDGISKGQLRNLRVCRCSLDYILLPPPRALPISSCFAFFHDVDMLTVSSSSFPHWMTTHVLWSRYMGSPQWSFQYRVPLDKDVLWLWYCSH